MLDVVQEGAKAITPEVGYAYAGAALGAGLAVVGAGIGIGKLAAGAAEGIARQPSAAGPITTATQLPLFLLEGVAILAVVSSLLVILLK